MEPGQGWHDCLGISARQAGPANTFNSFICQEGLSFQDWQQQKHQQECMLQGLAATPQYQTNAYESSQYPNQGVILLPPTLQNIIYPTANYQQPMHEQMSALGTYPMAPQVHSNSLGALLPVLKENESDDGPHQQFPFQSAQQGWQSSSQVSEQEQENQPVYQQPLQPNPRFVPPVQVSSGGLLSPDGGGPRQQLYSQRPLTPTPTAQQRNGRETAEPTSSLSSSSPSPLPEEITLADVNRFMSPCRRSELRRCQLNAGRGQILPQPVDVDGLYAELQEEVRESRRNQRQRDVWVAKHLRSGRRRRAQQGVGDANNNGGMELDVDVAPPAGPLAYQQMIHPPIGGVPWFPQELPHGMLPTMQPPVQTTWAAQESCPWPQDPFSFTSLVADADVSHMPVSDNMGDVWNMRAGMMGTTDGQYTAQGWPCAADWDVRE